MRKFVSLPATCLFLVLPALGWAETFSSPLANLTALGSSGSATAGAVDSFSIPGASRTASRADRSANIAQTDAATPSARRSSLEHPAPVSAEPHPTPSSHVVISARLAADGSTVSDAELLQWTAQAVVSTLNINFHDHAEQLNLARRNFSDNGWNNVQAAYLSDTVALMDGARMLCFTNPPKVSFSYQTSAAPGNLSYEIEVRVTQVCQSAQQEITMPMVLLANVLISGSQVPPERLIVDRLVAVQP